MILNIKFHDIPCISSWAKLAEKFLSPTHRHTDKQTGIFQKQSNRVQDIPKRVNPPKSGNRKFARNQYFLLLIKMKVTNKVHMIRYYLTFLSSLHSKRTCTQKARKTRIFDYFTSCFCTKHREKYSNKIFWIFSILLRHSHQLEIFYHSSGNSRPNFFFLFYLV